MTDDELEQYKILHKKLFADRGCFSFTNEPDTEEEHQQYQLIVALEIIDMRLDDGTLLPLLRSKVLKWSKKMREFEEKLGLNKTND